MDYSELACELLGLRSNRRHIRYGQTIAQLMKPEVYVLNYLQDHQNMNTKVHPKNLSDELLVSTARVAVLLNHLEEKGFVYRVPDDHDNRQTVVMLSEKGRAILQKYRQEFMAYVEKILQRMGEEDAKEYVRLQEKFVCALMDP